MTDLDDRPDSVADTSTSVLFFATRCLMVSREFGTGSESRAS